MSERAMAKSGWYVVDGDKRLRGPYKYAETAAAIRTEMERDERWDETNLCVARLLINPPQIGGAS